MRYGISSGMPSLISKEFDAIHQHIASLHIQWKIYRDLFASCPEIVATLNIAAPTFARCIQDTLQDSICLGLTRLTDPASTGKHDNLTPRRLEQLLDGRKYAKAKQELISLLDQAVAKASSFRNLRNKRIAHSDLNEQMKAAFTRSSHKDVENVLEILRTFMSKFYQCFNAGDIAYEYTTFVGGSDSMLFWLQEGLRLDDIRKQCAYGKLAGKELRRAVMSRTTLDTKLPSMLVS